MNPLCSICLELFKSTEAKAKSTPCGHIFHPHCVDQWILKKANCPECRETCSASTLRTIFFNCGTALDLLESNDPVVMQSKIDELKVQIDAKNVEIRQYNVRVDVLRKQLIKCQNQLFVAETIKENKENPSAFAFVPGKPVSKHQHYPPAQSIIVLRDCWNEKKMQNLLILVEPPKGALKTNAFQVPNVRLEMIKPTKEYFSKMRKFDKCFNDIVVLNKTKLGPQTLALAEPNCCLEDFSPPQRYCRRGQQTSSESSEASSRDSEDASFAEYPMVYEFDPEDQLGSVHTVKIADERRESSRTGSRLTATASANSSDQELTEFVQNFLEVVKQQLTV